MRKTHYGHRKFKEGYNGGDVHGSSIHFTRSHYRFRAAGAPGMTLFPMWRVPLRSMSATLILPILAEDIMNELNNCLREILIQVSR